MFCLFYLFCKVWGHPDRFVFFCASEVRVASAGLNFTYKKVNQERPLSALPSRGARLAAITSGGAIPDTAQYQVIAEPEGSVIGSLDEDYAIESMAGSLPPSGWTGVEMSMLRP